MIMASQDGRRTVPMPYRGCLLGSPICQSDCYLQKVYFFMSLSTLSFRDFIANELLYPHGLTIQPRRMLEWNSISQLGLSANQLTPKLRTLLDSGEIAREKIY